MQDPQEDHGYDFGLFLLNKILLKTGKSLALCPDMPLVAGDWDDQIGNRFIAEQRDYDPVQEMQKAAQGIARLNQGQKAAHDQCKACKIITHAVLKTTCLY